MNKEFGYAIGRPINGIPVNGLEYILDDKNELMLFSTKAEAVSYLKEHGVPDDGIDDFTFQYYTKCLNCGKMVTIDGDDIMHDDLGDHVVCPMCESSFDI